MSVSDLFVLATARQQDQEIMESTAPAKTRSSALTAAEIKVVTDLAEPLGVVQADIVRSWNAEHPDKTVSEAVVSKYVKYKREHNDYFVAGKRGPKPLLTPPEEERLLRLTVMTRRLGWPVTANRFAALARGVAAKARGSR
ncbi:hypothetical protein DIPPA_23637 [Diplonema papillatum]|nr:hypothetical protein DIPPA_23637 [Diplonema papillatum]